MKNISKPNGITSNAKQQLNSVLIMTSKMLSNKALTLTEVAHKKTMSEKEIQNAMSVLFPAEMFETLNTKAGEAMVKYNAFQNAHDTTSVSRQEKAGLVFPPAQTEKFLRNFGYSKVMVTNLAPVYMASVLESLTDIVLSSALPFAQKNKRVRLTVRDLELGVRSDEHLNRFFSMNDISFLGGGVLPFIHPSLQVRRTRKNRGKKSTADGEKKKHRFRPGTVSLREIRKFQKMSDCLTFAKYPFEKLVREVIAEHYQGDSDMKVSKNVFIILQHFVEQRVVDLLKNANFAAIHAGRVKLMPVDIEFVYAIQERERNPHQPEVVEVESDNENDEHEEKDNTSESDKVDTAENSEDSEQDSDQELEAVPESEDEEASDDEELSNSDEDDLEDED